MRMMTQFANVMANVLALKRDGRLQEAIEEIRQMNAQLVAADAQALAGMAVDELAERLRSDGRMQVQRALMVADLFQQDGEIRSLQGQLKEALDSFEKSLVLRLEVFDQPHEALPLDFHETTKRLLESLNIVSLDFSLTFKIYRYLYLVGNYAGAENALFHLASIQPEAVRIEGKSFYDRLLKKSDDELKDGGLPRSEVMEGLEDFIAETRST